MAGSPWGQIQHSNPILRGVRIVSTAGHGGVMVTRRFAKNYLTKAAIERGQEYGNYLCYEEDCDMSIVIFECRYKIYPELTVETEKELIKSLSLWNADYLFEIGVTPSEDEYANWLKRKEQDKLRSEASQDLIISARRTDEDENILLVHTADDKSHFIRREGYSEMYPKLLSKCTIVEQN